MVEPCLIAVALISARESVATLSGAVDAARVALAGLEPAVLDIVVNGNPDLAQEMAALLRRDARPGAGGALRVRLWSLPMGDKAHAWNTYAHTIWPQARTTVFIDGYVRVDPGALRRLHEALGTTQGIVAATGVPSVGRSARRLARQMQQSGGIHGNLCAMNHGAMLGVRSTGFRLPLGLYRVDGLMGAAVCFQFDPAGHDWQSSAIRVLPEVTWSFDPLRWWRYKDLRSHFKRAIRQRQGVLENHAVRHFLRDRKIAPQNLPHRADELVEAWIQDDPGAAERLLNTRRGMRRSLAQLRLPRDWSRVGLGPTCLVDTTEPGDVPAAPGRQR
jgi:hypothetical protein